MLGGLRVALRHLSATVEALPRPCSLASAAEIAEVRNELPACQYAIVARRFLE
jgi:hypothetical protein